MPHRKSATLTRGKCQPNRTSRARCREGIGRPAQQGCELKACTEILRALQSVEPAHPHEMHVAKSPQCVEPRGLVLGVPIDKRLTCVSNERGIGDQNRRLRRTLVLE